jgi:hypothetical protein
MTEPLKRKSVSYSQYSTWQNCPLQWKLQYIDKLKGERSIELIFGNAMHETIQAWLKILYEEKDTPIRAKTFDMHEFYKEALKTAAKEELLSGEKQLTTKDELIEYYVDGCKILDHMRQYAGDWFQKPFELKGVELPLEIELENNLKFTGYIDVVLWHKSAKTLYIYDFKTSRWGWTHQKKDPKKTDQLLLYKKFYSQKYGIPQENIKVEFIILKRKINEHAEFKVKHVVGFEPSHGSISMKRTTERFDNFINTAFNPDGSYNLTTVHPTPSESACKYCAFNNDDSKCSVSFYLPASKIKLRKNTDAGTI